MAQLLVPDALWEVVEPLLPKHEPNPKGGHPRVPDRVCLTGILFVLKTGLPWEEFPREMGCSGMTLWNRLDEWRAAGVWDELHRALLGKLRAEDQIDFSRVVVDSSSVRAVHGGKNGPQPRGPREGRVQAPPRGRRQRHPAGRDPHRGQPPRRDPTGAAGREDPGGRRQGGTPLTKPQVVMGDRGYDSGPHRMALSCKGIATRIARRNTPHGSGLGIFRYVVEQTIALMHQFRRLRVRYDKRDDVHEAFLTIGEAFICWRRLHTSSGYF